MSHSQKGLLEEIKQIDAEFCGDVITTDEAKIKLGKIMDIVGVEFVLKSIFLSLKSEFIRNEKTVH